MTDPTSQAVPEGDELLAEATGAGGAKWDYEGHAFGCQCEWCVP